MLPKKITYNGNTAKFIVKNDEKKANLFRRILMSEIPCLAIDRVEIYANTTTLNQQEIENRLFMIPIILEEKSDKNISDIIENWSEKNEQEVFFDVEYEWKTKHQKLMSQDLKIYGNDNLKLFENIIILFANKNHSIEFRAWLKVGKGLQHAKWNTVSQVGFKNVKKGLEFSVTSLGQYDIENLLKKAEEIYIKMAPEYFSKDEEDDSWLDE